MTGGHGLTGRCAGLSMKPWLAFSLAVHLCGATLVAALVPNGRTLPPIEVSVVEFSRFPSVTQKQRDGISSPRPVPALRTRSITPAVPLARPRVTTGQQQEPPAPPVAVATVAAPVVREERHTSETASPPFMPHGAGVSQEARHQGNPDAVPRSGAGDQAAGRTSGGPHISDVSFGTASGLSYEKRVLPVYPFQARRFGREGKVLLRLTVDENGMVQQVEVVKDPGYGFAAAAEDAVRRSRFSPARRDGHPIISRALLPVSFTLRSND